MVVNASSHGVVTLRTDEDTLFKVNGQHLKIFLEPIRPSEVVDELDFIIFPQYEISFFCYEKICEIILIE
jgi:hypothetical protein